jgi:IS4 transposase
VAALYHERWAAETLFAEIKVTLPGERLMLRSRRVDLAEQEVFGLLLTHFALRRLMVQASAAVDGDPDELSFLQTVVRRHLPLHAAFSPSPAPEHAGCGADRDPLGAGRAAPP